METGWVKFKLAELCDKITDGSHYSPKELSKGEKMIATVKDMDEFGFDIPNCKRISDEDFQNLVNTGCKPVKGDVLFSKDGTIGIIQYFKGDIDIVLLSSIAILKPKADKIDGRFLAYYLKNPYTNKFIKDNFKSGSALPRIVLKDLKKLNLSIPEDVSEQSHIASILSSLDDKIELNLKMNETLEGIAQAIFKEWFADFRFPGFDGEMVDGLPEGWRRKTIADVIDIKGGSTPSTIVPDYWNGDFHWATPKDLSSYQSPVLLSTERTISEEGVKQISSGILPKGTLLLSSRAPIGYLAISQIPISINQGFIAIQGRELSNLFMLFWLKNNMDSVKSRANGSTFQEISKSNFKEIDIIVPSRSLLETFDNVVGQLFKKIVTNVRQNQSLAEIRDKLLPKLMTGKIRVA